jgi:hypothetical protein
MSMSISREKPASVNSPLAASLSVASSDVVENADEGAAVVAVADDDDAAAAGSDNDGGFEEAEAVKVART